LTESTHDSSEKLLGKHSCVSWKYKLQKGISFIANKKNMVSNTTAKHH